MKTETKNNIGYTVLLVTCFIVVGGILWIIMSILSYPNDVQDPDLDAFNIENRRLVIDMSYFEAESLEDAWRAYGRCEDGVSEVCRIPMQELTELGKRIRDAILIKKLNAVLDRKRKARGQK